MKISEEEKKLLAKLASGALDGLVGNDFVTSGGSRVWTVIKNGKPIRYKQGPSKRFFNGKENEVIDGVLHVLKEWNTEGEKLDFFQTLGWLIKDLDVQKYSAKFKPKR